MLKIYTLICLFFISSIALKGQAETSSFELEMGVPKSDKWGNTASDMFHLDNGNILELNLPRVGSTLSFRLYDSEMNFMEKYNFKYDTYHKRPLNDHKIRIEFFRKISNKYYLFYSLNNGSDMELVAVEFDAEGLSFGDKTKPVLKKSLSEHAKKYVLSLSRSNDKSKLLLTLYEADGQRAETAYHYLLNKDLRTIKKAKFFNKDKGKGYIYESSAVSNTGTIISLGLSIEEGPVDSVAFKTMYMPLELQVLDFEKSQAVVRVINIDDKQFTNTVLGFGDEGKEILIGGFFRAAYSTVCNGVFLVKMDALRLSIEFEELTPFNKEMLSSSVVKKTIIKGLHGSGLKYPRIKRIIENQDGSYYFILDSRLGWTSFGLTIIKLDEFGVLEWDKHILRGVSGNESYRFDATLAIKTFSKDDKLHVLMNHGNKYENIKIGNPFETGSLKTNLVVYSFDEYGESSYTKLASFSTLGSAMLNSYAFKDGYMYFKAGGPSRKSSMNRLKIYDDSDE